MRRALKCLLQYTIVHACFLLLFLELRGRLRGAREVQRAPGVWGGECKKLGVGLNEQGLRD